MTVEAVAHETARIIYLPMPEKYKGKHRAKRIASRSPYVSLATLLGYTR